MRLRPCARTKAQQHQSHTTTTGGGFRRKRLYPRWWWQPEHSVARPKPRGRHWLRWPRARGKAEDGGWLRSIGEPARPVPVGPLALAAPDVNRVPPYQLHDGRSSVRLESRLAPARLGPGARFGKRGGRSRKFPIRVPRVTGPWSRAARWRVGPHHGVGTPFPSRAESRKRARAWGFRRDKLRQSPRARASVLRRELRSRPPVARKHARLHRP